MKQGQDIGKLDYVIEEPAVPNPLPEQYRFLREQDKTAYFKT
jgi:hypothetical protein